MKSKESGTSHQQHSSTDEQEEARSLPEGCARKVDANRSNQLKHASSWSLVVVGREPICARFRFSLSCVAVLLINRRTPFIHRPTDWLTKMQLHPSPLFQPFTSLLVHHEGSTGDRYRLCPRVIQYSRQPMKKGIEACISNFSKTTHLLPHSTRVE